MNKPNDQESGRGISRRAFVAGATTAAAAGMLSGDAVPLAGGEAAPAGGVAPATIARRPFGTTGAEICSVGLGAGSRFYGSTPDDEAAAELVRRCIDMGVEFIETSANYGPDGISEKRIGLAMKTHRSRVFLETKVDDRTYDGALREVERSLQRMHSDQLDLVLHHFVKPGELDVIQGRTGAERALRRLVDEKVVRFRGFSTHLPDVALDGMERLDPHAIQLPINAVRVPDFESRVLPDAQERGVAVIAMKTCGNGYFFPANATPPDRIEQYGPPPGAWEKWDIPSWTDYIHYALSLPIAAATIGIDSHFTLEGIVAAAQGFSPLTGERMASISQRAQVFATTGYWIPRPA